MDDIVLKLKLKTPQAIRSAPKTLACMCAEMLRPNLVNELWILSQVKINRKKIGIRTHEHILFTPIGLHWANFF